MREIAPDIYLETQYPGGNVGFVDTGRGVICIDLPMMPDDARQWLDLIGGTTAQPIAAIVQTDYDMPRVLSTTLVARSSGSPSVIAHDAVWEPMAKVYGRERMIQQINGLLGDGADWHVRMPDVTFDDRLILKKGNREIHVLHAGGHSAGTSIVYVPDERLVFSGDLVFNGLHPTMQYAESRAWLTALNRLRKMAVETVVPGRGEVGDKEITYPLSDYIREIRAVVRKSYRAGRTKSDTAKAVIPQLLGAFPYDPTESERLSKQIRESSNRVYDEYRMAARARRRNEVRRKHPSR
jgi:cyclase